MDMNERLRNVEVEIAKCTTKLVALEDAHQHCRDQLENLKAQWFKLLVALMGAGGGVGAAVAKWLG